MLAAPSAVQLGLYDSIKQLCAAQGLPPHAAKRATWRAYEILLDRDEEVC